MHDLSHSFASQLASTGASLPLIGALLGHSNPSTTARYAHTYSATRSAKLSSASARSSKPPATAAPFGCASETDVPCESPQRMALVS
jgi:hypothetical protein